MHKSSALVKLSVQTPKYEYSHLRSNHHPPTSNSPKHDDHSRVKRTVQIKKVGVYLRSSCASAAVRAWTEEGEASHPNQGLPAVDDILKRFLTPPLPPLVAVGGSEAPK